MRMFDADQVVGDLTAKAEKTDDLWMKSILFAAAWYLDSLIGPMITSPNTFDEVEEHPNCTVQILSNSKTGEVSVGWWENAPEVQEG